MTKDSSLNFLPDEVKKDANDALKGQQGSQNREMKLVVPTFDKNGGTSSSGKKLSWWEKRKQKKEEKKREKMRKKGETAIKDATKTKKGEPVSSVGSVKSQLFTDAPMPSAPKELKKEIPKPKMQPTPKQEEKKVVEKKKEEPVLVRPMKAPEQPEEKKDVEPVKSSEPKKEKKEVKKEEKKTSLSFTEIEAEPMQSMHQPEKNEPAGPSSPTVNLVPDSVRVADQGQPWILAVIALLIFIAIWFVAAGIAVTHVKDVESEVFAKQQELDKFTSLIQSAQTARETSEKLQKQFTAVEEVLDRHVYWSPFFENLEATTIPDVYYIRLNVTQTGTVVMRAIAKSYAAAARQIRAFEKAPSFVDSISVNEVVVELQPEAVLPVPIVAFDIELDLADGLLKKDFTSDANQE